MENQETGKGRANAGDERRKKEEFSISRPRAQLPPSSRLFASKPSSPGCRLFLFLPPTSLPVSHLGSSSSSAGTSQSFQSNKPSLFSLSPRLACAAKITPGSDSRLVRAASPREAGESEATFGGDVTAEKWKKEGKRREKDERKRPGSG